MDLFKKELMDTPDDDDVDLSDEQKEKQRKKIEAIVKQVGAKFAEDKKKMESQMKVSFFHFFSFSFFLLIY
jgi:hypothetical protein